MRKTNDTSRPAALNDTLADSELDAVTGGFIADLVRQSIQLANEAHYQMMVNSIVAGNAAAIQSIIANWEKINEHARTDRRSWSARG